MGEGRRHRNYDAEFKKEAVRLVTERGVAVKKVAEDLGIHPAMLTRWKREYLNGGNGSFSGKGHLKPEEEELRQLRRENADLREERDILKKAFGHILTTRQKKYRFIEEHRGEFRVEKMCKVLKVSRSGYYAWRIKKPGKRQQENQSLLVRIQEIHKQSHRTYGSPRVTVELKEQGITCGKNRIARLMRENGIRAKTIKKYKATTDSNHKYPVAENLLGDGIQADMPNTVWASDITYISTEEGWLYLAVIMDILSRKVIGWSLKPRLTQELVIEAFRKAIRQRNPVSGLIHHSDQGSQYASTEYQRLLKEYGIMPSMSRKGNCYDNAYVESFFHTLKTELIYDERYRTRQEAILSVFDYIEVFYNRKRRHSALGYKSPAEFERLQYAA
ncbi:MAG: IS3 family transposase [Nitrospirota bacterium]